MEKKFIKPKSPDLKLRDPVTKFHLDPNGEEKVMNSFWLRRIQDGDVIVVDGTTQAKKEIKN